MHRRTAPATGLIAWLAAGWGLWGCASYQPSPLDLASHAELWSSRDAGDGSVRAFAATLEGSSPPPNGFDPDDGLSLAEGEVVALVYNPDLRIARLRAGVAEAVATHAGLWADPVLGVDFLTLTKNAPNPLLVAPSVGLTVPVSGRLEAERARRRGAGGGARGCCRSGVAHADGGSAGVAALVGGASQSGADGVAPRADRRAGRLDGAR